MPVQFKKLTPKQFTAKYTDAPLEDMPAAEGYAVGEVKIPGHGWSPAYLGKDGKPTQFWTEDDGWETVPQVAFVEVV